MKLYFTTLASAVLCAGIVICGQAKSGSAPDVEASVAPKRGDTITLRSGKTIQGVRVLSETQLEVTVEVLPDLPPLKLPANQVTSIQYGQPLNPSLESESMEPNQVDQEGDRAELLPALRLKLEFSRRLEEKMGGELEERQQGDIVAILKKIEKVKRIPLEFSAAVLARPTADRLCSMNLDREQTLDGFLKMQVPTAAPWLRIDYDFDTVKISLK